MQNPAALLLSPPEICLKKLRRDGAKAEVSPAIRLMKKS